MARTSAIAPKLTDKQKRFCDEYLVDMNATQAAIRAGYAEGGARAVASRMLANVVVQDYIQQRKVQLDKKLENKYLISKERLLDQYVRLGFSDIRAYFNEDGSLKNVASIDDDAAAALASTEIDTIRIDGLPVGTTSKIKVYDKIRALDSIAKIMGYNAPAKIDATVNGSLFDLFMAGTRTQTPPTE